MNKKIYTAPTFEPFTTEEMMQEIKIFGASDRINEADMRSKKKNNIDMEFEEDVCCVEMEEAVEGTLRSSLQELLGFEQLIPHLVLMQPTDSMCCP